MTENNISIIFNLFEKYEASKSPMDYYEIADYIEKLSTGEWDTLWDDASKLESERTKITLYMECLNYRPSNERFEKALTLLNQTTVFSWDEKFYLRSQIVALLFCNSKYKSSAITKLNCMLYQNIYNEFLSNFSGIEKIKDRNKDLIFVTVQQFLNMTHGPTKTTIDRAYILAKSLNKQVVIINTAEHLGGKRVLLSNSMKGNYMDLQTTEIQYQDATFPYFQFGKNMPNINSCNDFISFVQKNKPNYIVNIGGNSLLIDLCNEIVPVLNINTVPSALANTNAYVQAIGRKLRDTDDVFLSYINKTKFNVIEGLFTSMLKPQAHVYTREMLDIPEDAFIMAAIGARLTDEVTDDFIEALYPAFEQGALLFLIGKMDNYEEKCQADRLFGDHAIYLGLQEDVIALMDLCDIYVNPKRIGGGTSVVEAMFKGCPPVTLNFGDVALGAGEDFCVSDYKEMSETIIKYMNDKDFYNEMSQKAIERAKLDMDSGKAFTEIVNKFEDKIKKWY